MAVRSVKDVSLGKEAIPDIRKELRKSERRVMLAGMDKHTGFLQIYEPETHDRAIALNAATALKGNVEYANRLGLAGTKAAKELRVLIYRLDDAEEALLSHGFSKRNTIMVNGSEVTDIGDAITRGFYKALRNGVLPQDKETPVQELALAEAGARLYAAGFSAEPDAPMPQLLLLKMGIKPKYLKRLQDVAIKASAEGPDKFASLLPGELLREAGGPSVPLRRAEMAEKIGRQLAVLELASQGAGYAVLESGDKDYMNSIKEMFNMEYKEFAKALYQRTIGGAQLNAGQDELGGIIMVNEGGSVYCAFAAAVQISASLKPLPSGSTLLQ